MMKTRTFLLAAAVGALGVLPAAMATADDTGTVTILHGVPGLDVDVYADDELLIEAFTPGDQFGPTQLPAGDYDIAVRGAGDEPDAEPALAATLTVEAGTDATAVAHLDAGGQPTITPFANDVSQIPAGESRLVVRHTAAFGAVDVLAGGDAVISGLENPDEAALEVPAGAYDVAVTAAGDPDTQAFQGELTLEEGTAYLVHAIGDPGADTFDLLVQTIDGLHTAPSAVETGTGGLAAQPADPASSTGLAAFVVLAMASAAGVGIARTARSRATASRR